MSKLALIITYVVILIFVSATIILGALVFKMSGDNNKLLQQVNQNTIESSLSISAGKTLNIPIDIKNPSLASIRLVFQLKTTVSDIKKNGDNIEFSITPEIKNLPPLITNSNTVVYQLDSSNVPVKKTLADLKIGQKVGFYLAYKFYTKSWVISRINILPN